MRELATAFVASGRAPAGELAATSDSETPGVHDERTTETVYDIEGQPSSLFDQPQVLGAEA